MGSNTGDRRVSEFDCEYICSSIRCSQPDDDDDDDDPGGAGDDRET